MERPPARLFELVELALVERALERPVELALVERPFELALVERPFELALVERPLDWPFELAFAELRAVALLPVLAAEFRFDAFSLPA